MIRFKHKGDFSKCKTYFEQSKGQVPESILRKYGEKGVQALRSATPVDTGKTASSWYYKISVDSKRAIVSFANSNVESGANVAILIQYGHGTRNGGYVQGRDYINPTIRPIFDKMADEAWKEAKAR